jgi:hypothetical protein
MTTAHRDQLCINTIRTLSMGWPNTGVFLQITCGDSADLPIPGHDFSFGVVKAAQGRADFEVLAQRERRALRVHVRTDVSAGLSTLAAAIEEALH